MILATLNSGVSLLVYSLIPFFAVAGRLGLSSTQQMILPVAVLGVLIFFWRRVRGLVRKLRENGD